MFTLSKYNYGFYKKSKMQLLFLFVSQSTMNGTKPKKKLVFQISLASFQEAHRTLIV